MECAWAALRRLGWPRGELGGSAGAEYGDASRYRGLRPGWISDGSAATAVVTATAERTVDRHDAVELAAASSGGRVGHERHGIKKTGSSARLST